MTQLFTQFAAEETSGIGALGLNLEALLIQLATFVLAFLVLRKFAFEPIGKVLRERRELIESGVKLGEDMRQERARLDEEAAAQVREARLQADSIVAQANDTSRAAVAEAEAKARAKADAIIADAHTRGEQDVNQMRKQLEKELVGLVSDATEAIIDEKVDASKDADLIDRALRSRSGRKSGSTA